MRGSAWQGGVSPVGGQPVKEGQPRGWGSAAVGGRVHPDDTYMTRPIRPS